MTNDFRDTGEAQPTAVDTAASNACTRSGAFALLLSAVLFLLVPYWLEKPEYTALSRYLSYRLALSTTVDSLKDNPFWQKHKASHSDAESMSITELLKTNVEASKTEPTKVQTDATLSFKKSNHRAVTPKSPLTPTAPTLSGSVQVTIEEMPEIADLLRKLNNSDMLTFSRRVSNFFDLSIVRWVQKRNMLAYRNCTTTRLVSSDSAPKSDGFVPALYDEAMLECLTLSDVQELAQFELPAVKNPMELGGRIGKEISVTPGSLPRDLYLASLLSELLLFFTIVYFSAFAREAVSSHNFPVPGTLFGAFSNSRHTLLVLQLAIWLPALSSLTVALASHTILLMLCTVLVVLSAVAVQTVLHRKSYFTPLNSWSPWRRLVTALRTRKASPVPSRE